MAHTKGLRSTIVDGLKVLLPLAALALLSTLFLFSKKSDPELSLPFADALGEDETARQQVTAPVFTGTTSAGRPMTLTAEVVIPDGDDQFRAERLNGKIEMSDGTVDLQAALAEITSDGEMATLSGGVRIVGSGGYDLSTEAMTADSAAATLYSHGPVEGMAPAGHLSAGRMEITAEAMGAPARMHFTQGVKLVYEPQGE